MSAFKEWVTHPYTIRAGQLITGVIMGVAGLAKVGNLEAFAANIHYFRAWPIPLENLMAMTLPWIEVVVAVALILGIRARAACMLSLGMLIVFTVAIVQAVARNLDIECGCFGTGDGTRVGLKKLAENGGMILAAWVGTLRAKS